jgi:hypothetical protein
VILFVFSNLHGRLEPIVVAMFGLIYVSIRSGAISTAITFGNFAIELQSELNLIKAAINPDADVGWQAWREAKEELYKARKPIWYEVAGLNSYYEALDGRRCSFRPCSGCGLLRRLDNSSQCFGDGASDRTALVLVGSRYVF